MLLQFGDELVQGFLHAVLFIAALVFAEVAFFFLLLDLVDRITAQVAQGDLAFFGIFRGQLAEFLAPLFGEGER